MPQIATVGAAPAYDMSAGSGAAHRNRIAWTDLLDGARLYRLATMLGWLDIKLRYRGSVLGPFWLTLSTGVMILSMGVLYAALFHIDVRQYLPFLGLSLVLWNAMSAMVMEACTCFTGAINTIHAIRMPFTTYAVRTLVRNALVLAHNAVVIIAVYAYFDIWPGASSLLALPGLALWVVDGIACCLLLGAICARFRDIPPIMGSVIQIGFFLTPIIWQPESVGTWVPFLVANPFYPLLAVVRDPLLNHPPGGLIWTAAVAWSVLLCAAAWVLFARVRGRLAFWVWTAMALIEVDDLSVEFPLYHGDARSLKKMVLSTASGRLAQDSKHVVVQALRNIAFTLRPGDRLALVGRNGAGKTTLLRALAGIYEPQAGRIRLEGRVSTLLDSSLGMNVDMTGQENVTLRGLYNGMTRPAIARMTDDVAEFAELGEFFRLPVKFYSSGMSLRLAFAMATAVHPEILLMDEWMLAGDANFMDKARARVDAFVSKAEILVLSTHNDEVVRQWATRVLWLDQGRILQDGPPDDVLEAYLGKSPTLSEAAA